MFKWLRRRKDFKELYETWLAAVEDYKFIRRFIMANLAKFEGKKRVSYKTVLSTVFDMVDELRVGKLTRVDKLLRELK